MDVLVLGRADVERCLTVADCIVALEDAFRSADDVQSFVGGAKARGGSFHLKAALAGGEHPMFAAKLNGNFPDNPRLRQLPTIQGLLILSDGTDGRPLAIMDSGALTVIRTAAASGVVAKYAAHPDAKTVGLVGCGRQAMAQLQAMQAVRPVEQVRVFDMDAGAARGFASEAAAALGLRVDARATLEECTREADIVITSTTSTRAFLGRPHVKDGAFVAAVGADSGVKSEIEPALMAHAVIVCDDPAQCAASGDLRSALADGAVTTDQVWGTITDLVGGKRLPADARAVVFDSTGIPIEDVAAATLVYERARAAGVGVVASL
jgi:alanine dehydrogenase